MKKLFYNHVYWTIFVLSLLLVVVCLGIFFGLRSRNLEEDVVNDNAGEYRNGYFFTNSSIYDNVDSYTSKKLEKEHCLEDVCLLNLKVYDLDEEGKITFDIENRGDKVTSAYLMLSISDKEYKVVYQNLEVNSSNPYTIQYMNYSLGKPNDYSIRYLTDSEIQSIDK